MFKRILLLLAAFSVFGHTAEVDPTRPLSAKYSKQKKAPTLYLQSIIIDEGSQNRAIVNGVVLKQGQYIHGHQVVKIDNDYVIVRSKNKTRTLSLFSSAVKKSK